MVIHTAEVGALGTNCYIVETNEKNAVIIDPGARGKELINSLEDMNLTPKMIFLTHAHHDHIGGIADFRDKYADIPIYMGPEEEGTVMLAIDRIANKKSAAIVVSDGIVLEDGQEIALDEVTFKVMRTPGHSSGGVIYITEDKIFSGDTLFREEIGRCDLPTGSYDTMLETLAKIAKLPGDYDVYPGHAMASTLEHERKNNPYMKDLI